MVGRSHHRGAERFAAELVEELDSRGNTDRLVAVGPGHLGDRDPAIPVLTPHVRQDPLALVRAAVALRRELSREPIDVVLAHGGSAQQAAVLANIGRRNKVPVVYQLILAMPVAERGPLWRWWWRWVLRRSAGAVALTSELGEEVRGLGLRGPVWLVPNARKADRFVSTDRPVRRVALRHDLGLAPSAPLIAFVGHLVEQKRPDVAVDVLERVRAGGIAAHLVIVGQGPLADEISAQVDRLGLAAHVSMLGHRDDVEAVMAGVDLMLMTSDHEGMSGVMIEAQMTGCPIVSFPVGGASEVVADGVSGVVLASHDRAEMAASVSELLAEPERLSAMSDAARSHAERFSMSSAADAYEYLFSKVVADP